MFDSLLGIVKDAVRVVTAPVEIAADVAKSVTEPIADATQEVVDGVKEVTGQDKK